MKALLALVPQEFPEKQELHRNMLGLLGNVAEVKELRPQLMTSQFISVFRSVRLGRRHARDSVCCERTTIRLGLCY